MGLDFERLDFPSTSCQVSKLLPIFQPLADSCQHSARRIAGDKWDGSALRRINAQHQKQILAERPAATPEVQQ
jgi:hypothetical protein